MKERTLSIRISNDLKFRLERIIDGEFWKNESDFVREAIEKHLKKFERKIPDSVCP